MNSSIKTLLAVAVSLTATAITSPTLAVTFTGNAVGAWSSPSVAGTGATYTITNNDDKNGANSLASFEFGTANSRNDDTNLFTFDGTGSGNKAGFSTPNNTPFDIGAFTYRNGTTSASSYPAGNSSVKLGVTLNLTTPLMNTSAFTYNFNIDITPNNTGNPNTDADTVTIGNGTTATMFTYGGTAYTLTLLGFSKNGGSIITNMFTAPEQSTTGADLFATITTNVLPVPEPASMALLGTGLLGACLLRRRRR